MVAIILFYCIVFYFHSPASLGARKEEHTYAVAKVFGVVSRVLLGGCYDICITFIIFFSQS